MTEQSACQPCHRYFENRSCRYYPCHPGADPDRFNCLFCFCPLYFLDACGGDFRMVKGVKDCTPCLRPHRPEGYDEIVERLKREIGKRRDDSQQSEPGAAIKK